MSIIFGTGFSKLTAWIVLAALSAIALVYGLVIMRNWGSDVPRFGDE